jgi:hypothetical protein
VSATRETRERNEMAHEIFFIVVARAPLVLSPSHSTPDAVPPGLVPVLVLAHFPSIVALAAGS